MSWDTVVNVFAVIGAFYLTLTVGLLVVGLLLTKNADGVNRHSKPTEKGITHV